MSLEPFTIAREETRPEVFNLYRDFQANYAETIEAIDDRAGIPAYLIDRATTLRRRSLELGVYGPPPCER